MNKYPMSSEGNDLKQAEERLRQKWGPTLYTNWLGESLALGSFLTKLRHLVISISVKWLTL